MTNNDSSGVGAPSPVAWFGRRLLQPAADPLDGVVSIHAPARGATPAPGCSSPAGASFDPHPREGGDRRRLAN